MKVIPETSERITKIFLEPLICPATTTELEPGFSDCLDTTTKVIYELLTSPSLTMEINLELPF